jgi:hypothetical protein
LAAQFLCSNPFRRVSSNEIEFDDNDDNNEFNTGGNLEFNTGGNLESDTCGDVASDGGNDEFNTGANDEFKSEGGWFIVMDYVPRRSPDHCWNDLDEESREKATSQTARMIEEMQSVPLNHLPSGPIGGQTRSETHVSLTMELDRFRLPGIGNLVNHKLDMLTLQTSSRRYT